MHSSWRAAEKNREKFVVTWDFGQVFTFPRRGPYEIIKTDNYFGLPPFAGADENQSSRLLSPQ
jgi:hypothetical protein